MPSNPIAQRNHDRLFGDRVSTLSTTDPELIEYFGNFALGEVYEHGAPSTSGRSCSSSWPG
jgi:4-carboxymuconolactone decarboxylase